MIKKLLKFIIPAVLVGLFIGGIAYADSANYWLISGTYLKPLFSTYGLQLPTLTNKGCLGTDSSGHVQTGSLFWRFRFRCPLHYPLYLRLHPLRHLHPSPY